jgi:hypothetical protein
MSLDSITSSPACSIESTVTELVSGKRSGTSREVCGKWMPRKQAFCARILGHKGDCRTAEALADSRARQTARRKGVRLRDDPEARRRWGRKHKLTRYGLTQKQFDWLLEVQQYACAMGGEPFTESTQIFVDHDHSCCPGERQSCGKCVRGLLCLSCNTALGQIERKTGLARAYLAAPPGRLLSVA